MKQNKTKNINITANEDVCILSEELNKMVISEYDWTTVRK